MSGAVRVLLVDDDAGCRRGTRRFLEARGYEVIEARSGREGIARLGDGVAVIVTDLVMPGGVDGLELLRAARVHAAHAPVILLTGQGSERAAVEALKAGAFHYLTKPAEPEELASLVKQAREKHAMAEEIACLHERLRTLMGLGQIIGRSEPMVRLFERIRMIADSSATVLVEGESGSGKELVARALHDESSRRSRPFVAFNCAALPAALVESELFGHVRGAYTGATEARAGKFQAAAGGTLLIDEIGDLPLELQPKLLRVLETHRFSPVGSDAEVSVDVRIVAATNRSLHTMVGQRLFREDLYYRLAVVPLHVPALRERPDDVPLLVSHFMGELALLHGRPTHEVSPDALARLQTYAWPGNVRQLRNVIEELVLTCPRPTIEVSDLPSAIQADSSAPRQLRIPPGTSLATLERVALVQALGRHAGNRTQAARELGISVRTLQRRLRAEDEIEHGARDDALAR